MVKRNTILSVLLVLALGVLVTAVVLAARPAPSDAQAGDAGGRTGPLCGVALVLGVPFLGRKTPGAVVAAL